MFELVENFSDETDRSQAYAWPSEDDPKDLVRTSRAVTYMKSHLEKWKAEVANLKDEAEKDFECDMDFSTDSAGKTRKTQKIPLLHAGAYLTRLAREYDHKIRKCDAILATASMAFQMVSSNVLFV